MSTVPNTPVATTTPGATAAPAPVVVAPAFVPTAAHNLAISKAKVSLMSDKNFMFYTTMLLNMHMLWDDKVPTACTNGKYIKIGPEFFMKLNPPERMFILVHEVSHVAKSHMTRRGNRTPKRWNYACDYNINDELIQLGLSMPAVGLHDVNYRGLSSEEIYDLLPEDENEYDNNDVMDIEDADPNDPNAQQQIDDLIMQAATQARMAGQPGAVPGDVQMFLDKLLNPKLPWYVILKKFFFEINKNDYSMAKPNRRFLPQFFLPSLIGEGMGPCEVHCDISGSVSDNDFTQFVTETFHIMKELQPEYIDFVQFDTEIHSVDRVTHPDELSKLTFTGRGGTDIDCIMDRINKTKPKVAIIFTDGGFYFNEGVGTSVPVVWVIHDNLEFTAPFGKVIHYHINTSKID